jgi:hypothetical protein
MAFAQSRGSGKSSAALRLSDRLTHGLIGMEVIFAALGLGEAVDRFTILDFDGATDRLPIEMLFRVGIRLDDYETGQKDLPTPNGDLRANHVDSGSQQQDSSRGESNHARAISEESASHSGHS